MTKPHKPQKYADAEDKRRKSDPTAQYSKKMQKLADGLVQDLLRKQFAILKDYDSEEDIRHARKWLNAFISVTQVTQSMPNPLGVANGYYEMNPVAGLFGEDDSHPMAQAVKVALKEYRDGVEKLEPLRLKAKAASVRP